jgi:DNA replication protein DnaC
MMNDTLAQQLKYLRLPGLLARWDEHLKAAAQSNLSHARFLTRVIEEEYRLKCDQARQQRLKHAKIPELWVMDTFPFHRQPKLNKKKDHGPLRLDGLPQRQAEHHLDGRHRRGQNRPGHQLPHPAIEQGARGRYVLFADLLHELDRSQADRSQARVIRRYLRYDILLVDEIGYIEAEPAQVGLFFTLLQNVTNSARRSSRPISGLANGLRSSKTPPHRRSARPAHRASHVFNIKDWVSLRGKMPRAVNWRARADRLRALPLPRVLAALEATADPGDPAKWRCARGVLSVTGPKFINWNLGVGGGGAIDLVMHVRQVGFGQALEWLEARFGVTAPTQPSAVSTPRTH